jgi:hypothetical protein
MSGWEIPSWATKYGMLMDFQQTMFDYQRVSGWWFGTFLIFHNKWEHPSH